MAVEVREICERYGLPYSTGSFRHRLWSTWIRSPSCRCPTPGPATTTTSSSTSNARRKPQPDRFAPRSQPPSTAPARRGGGRYHRDTGIIEEGLTWSTASNATGHDPGTGQNPPPSTWARSPPSSPRPSPTSPGGRRHHHRRLRMREAAKLAKQDGRAALSTPTTPNSTTTPMSPVPTPRTPR